MSPNQHDQTTTAMLRERLLDQHRETVATVIEAGRAVDRTLPDTVTEASSIDARLEAELAHRALSESLLELLEDVAGAINEPIQGQPVPAPPYLVVTSRGPICRGTLATGTRLVIELELWAVERAPVRYRFRDPVPEDCVQIALR
jgi:hypothetical protein